MGQLQQAPPRPAPCLRHAACFRMLAAQGRHRLARRRRFSSQQAPACQAGCDAYEVQSGASGRSRGSVSRPRRGSHARVRAAAGGAAGGGCMSPRAEQSPPGAPSPTKRITCASDRANRQARGPGRLAVLSQPFFGSSSARRALQAASAAAADHAQRPGGERAGGAAATGAPTTAAALARRRPPAPAVHEREHHCCPLVACRPITALKRAWCSGRECSGMISVAAGVPPHGRRCGRRRRRRGRCRSRQPPCFCTPAATSQPAARRTAGRRPAAASVRLVAEPQRRCRLAPARLSGGLAGRSSPPRCAGWACGRRQLLFVEGAVCSPPVHSPPLAGPLAAARRRRRWHRPWRAPWRPHRKLSHSAARLQTLSGTSGPSTGDGGAFVVRCVAGGSRGAC